MHAIILVLTVFLAPTPAADGKPAQPEHAEVKASVVPTGTICIMGGAAIVNQLRQDPKVVWATFDCLDAANPADKAA